MNVDKAVDQIEEVNAKPNPEEPQQGEEEPFKPTDINTFTKSTGNYLSQVFLCWCVQLTLCVLLIYEIFSIEDEDGQIQLAIYPANRFIVVVRFCCGVVLHMQLSDEFKNGMKNMKFVLNHPYRFDSPFIAFLAGFLQATSIAGIEVVNFFVILTSSTFLEVVMNFMALAIISDFDNAFYDSLGEDENKAIVEDPSFEHLYEITRTTSRFCHPWKTADGLMSINNNKLEDEFIPADVLTNADALKGQTKPENMLVTFAERTTYQKIMRCMYKVLRIFYMSVWFYFLPFIALLGSYLVPFHIQTMHAAAN